MGRPPLPPCERWSEIPNRPLHNWFAEFLGIDPRIADLVNENMDAPSKTLGPRHRIVRHDLPYAVRLAAQANRITVRNGKNTRQATPPEVLAAFAAHMMLDRASTNPGMRRFFKLVEAMM